MDSSKKPQIRFKEFTEDWEQRKFTSVFDGLQNNTLSRAELNYESGTVKNVHYGDVLIKFGDYIDASDTELPYISDDAKAEKFKNSLLQDGDIVIADTAEDEIVGKCTEIQGSEGMKLLSGLHTIACRPKEKYGSMFLGYYINSPAYHNQLKPLMQGIKVTSISKSALQDTDMIIPKTIEEQSKIGEYFSNIDNLITLQQDKYDKLVILKKSLLEKMFPKENSNIPEIRFKGFTEAWEQRKLSEISDVRDGTHDSPKYLIEGHPFITSKNVKDGYINYDDIQYISDKDFIEINKRSKVDKNDILFGMIGTIGNIALIRENPDFAIKNVALIKDKQIVYYLYLYHYLQSQNVLKQFEENKDGGTQQFIALNKIRDLIILLPSKEEQHVIGDYLEKLDNLITLHQNKLERLKDIKKSLLNKMFI